LKRIAITPLFPRAVLSAATSTLPSSPRGFGYRADAYDLIAVKDYEQRFVSLKGGVSPLEPHSLKQHRADASAKHWQADPASVALVAQ
jgi:hypothetical protein